jgi:citrate lyase alpha subunit
VDIRELKEKTERITGTPAHLKKGDRVVAEVIARTGETLDHIYNVPQD